MKAYCREGANRQDGMFRLFGPRFVNNGSVTAGLMCRTAYARHEVLAWLRAALCSARAWASPWKPWLLLLHGCVRWVSHERSGYGVSAATVAASARREAVYGCHASQDRINVSAVLAAPGVSAQPLSSSLACPGRATRVNSVNIKIIGMTDRNSKTAGVVNRRKSNPRTMLTDF